MSSLEYTDYLNIVYARPKNSVLPVGKTYKFPRVQHNVDAGENAGKDNVVMKTSPALLEALDELREIVEADAENRDLADAMRHELQRLEEEFAVLTERLRTLIGRIETK